MDIIGLLFKSQIRRKILVRFFAEEGRKFYINEMARLAGTSQGTCRRELNRLVDMDLLATSRTGNLLYYELNRQSPFFNEFRTIIQKTIGIEAIISNGLQGLKGIKFAFVFGSYAKNELGSGSDIDIAVIGSISNDRLIKAIRGAEGLIGREINYHLYSENEFLNNVITSSFTKNIIRNYIMMIGDDGEFRRLLEKAKS